MHLTTTMVPIKHFEEWLAYGNCSVNISSLHLNYNRRPFTTPTRPTSPMQPGLSFTMFSFHHSQFGLTSLATQSGTHTTAAFGTPWGSFSLALPPQLSTIPFMISPGRGLYNDPSSVFSTLIHPTKLYLFYEIPKHGLSLLKILKASPLPN